MLDFGTMKFAPNCGPLITSSSSASCARQNDAAKIDITPHKIGTGKIVFMWLSWNAEAGRSTTLTFLRSNRLWLRVASAGTHRKASSLGNICSGPIADSKLPHGLSPMADWSLGLTQDVGSGSNFDRVGQS